MYIIYEDFTQTLANPRLSWFHPPLDWGIAGGSLVIRPEAGTDFWQRTYYHFQRDTGHFLYAEVCGNFTMTTKVRSFPVHRYDQAGLMVRFSADCWLKTSVEYEQDGSKLGVVVTNQGYSDWSTQHYLTGITELYFRVRRLSGDYIVEYAEPCKEAIVHPSALTWNQIRIARLLEDNNCTPAMSGLYACSPQGKGFQAEFDYLVIQQD